MAKRIAQTLTYLYSLLVRLYPLSFRNRFGDEMESVFAAAMGQAAQLGTRVLAGFCLRELLCVPLSLLRACWSELLQKTGALRRPHTPLSSLPPPLPDGRASWSQVGFELSPFLSMGVVLILRTYLSIPLPSPDGWSGPGESSAILLLLPASLFLIGLARGLPRWAYPFGGMVLGYALRAAIRFHQLPALAAATLAFAGLAAAASAIHRWIRPLPTGLQRLGQSIRVDWTRLSFGVYGAMPLAIIAAFDNAYLNDRTCYLAVATLAMVAGALIYVRSRQTTMQVVALVSSTSLCFVCALLDHIYFVGVRGSWVVETGWLIRLWTSTSVLTSVPLLGILAQRVATRRRAA